MRLPRRPHPRCLLGCLALLVGLILAGNSWAQVGSDYVASENGYSVSTGSATPLVFPYLSVSKDQRTLLTNAYNFQSALFKGISGVGKDGATALYFLGLFGTLIGALLIVFFPKYQRPETIATWLLVVTLVIFAPFGSKLLFYPTNVDGSASSVPTCSASNTASVGSANLTSCGFTPQLLAIHLATTLQATFSDFFRSMKWKGIIEIARSTVNLRSNTMLTADADWLQKAETLANTCSMDFSLGSDKLDMQTINKTIEARTTQKSDMLRPLTFGQAWKEYMAFYKPGGVKQKYPPGMIILFKNKPENFSSSMAAKYERQFSILYNTWMGTSGVVVKFDSSSGNTISAEQAITDLKNNGFFDVHTSGHIVNQPMILPGFFITYEGATADDLKPAAGARQLYATPNTPASGYESDFYLNHRSQFGSVFYPKENTDSMWYGSGNSKAQWKKFADQIAEFEGMPVGYALAHVDLSSTNATASRPVTFLTSDFYNCNQQLAELVYRAVNVVMLNQLAMTRETVGQNLATRGSSTKPVSSRLNGLEGFKQMLLGTGLPVTNSEVTPEMLIGGKIDSVAQPQQNLAVDLAYFLTGSLLNANIRENQDNGVTSDGDLTPEEQRRLFLRRFVEIVASNTDGLLGLTTDAEKAAEVDSKNIAITGNNWLAQMSGNLATWAGKGLLGVGAFFTGGIAVAIVNFLSIMLDMCLLSLIVLTPILLMAGTVIPSAAMGMLTICTIGVFVLKFVPITLLILNNLGGLISEVITKGRPQEMATMQNMLIMGINGMYASLMTLSFFLIFKLSDPSAVLGRFTALDSAAKSLADTGMDAVKVAAGVAASIGFGALGGTAGAAMMKATRKVVGQAGLGDVMDEGMKLVGGRAPEEKGLVDGATAETPAPAASTPLTPEEQAAEDQRLAEEQATEDQRIAEEKAAEDQRVAEEEAAAAKLKADEIGVDGRTDSERMLDAGNYFKDGKNTFKEEKDHILYSDDSGKTVQAMTRAAAIERGIIEGTDAEKIDKADILGVDGRTDSERMLDAGNYFKDGKNTFREEGNHVLHSDDSGKTVQAMTRAAAIERGIIEGTQAERTALGGAASTIPTPTAPGAPPAPTAPGTPGAPAAATPGTTPTATVAQISSAPNSGTLPAAAAGSPGTASSGVVNVLVQGGSLDEIKSGRIDLTGAAMGTLNEEMANRQVRERADELQAMNRLRNDPAFAGKSAVIAAMDRQQALLLDPNASEDQIRAGKVDLIKQLAGTDKTLTSFGLVEAKRNQEISLTATRLTSMLADQDQIISDLKTQKQTEEVVEKLSKAQAFKEKLQNEDPIAWSMGEHFSKLGEFSKKLRLEAVRTGADVSPSVWKSFFSGMYGSLSGGGGALGKIPIIGPAFKESLNEFYQAPERLRAIQAAGGVGKWMGKTGDATRMGFYQKEIAPITAGHQYQEMEKVGAFQAQVDIARQSASEAVARSRSNFETMQYKTKIMERFDENGQPRGYLNAEEMRGLGALDSLNRINSVRAESLVMNGGTTVIKEYKVDAKNGTMEVNDKRVQNSMAMMDDIISGQSAKKMGKSMDEMLGTHYGIFEKRFFRNKDGWEKTTNVAGSDDAVREFAAMEVSNDYLVGGHLQMHQGKEKFFGLRGEYARSVHYRNMEAVQDVELRTRYKQEESKGQLKEFLEQTEAGKKFALRVTPNLSEADKRKLQDDFVKAELKVNGAVTPIFELAYKKGAAGFDLKSRGAKLLQREADAEVEGKLEKIRVVAAQTLGMKGSAVKKVRMRNKETGREVETSEGIVAAGDKMAAFINKLSPKDASRKADRFMDTLIDTLSKWDPVKTGKEREALFGQIIDKKDGTVTTTVDPAILKETAKNMATSFDNFTRMAGEDLLNHINGNLGDGKLLNTKDLAGQVMLGRINPGISGQGKNREYDKDVISIEPGDLED